MKPDPTKVVIPEVLIFHLLSKMTGSGGPIFEVKTMKGVYSIADSIIDDYPLLLHNSRVIQKANIIKYLKQISIGLYKPPVVESEGI